MGYTGEQKRAYQREWIRKRRQAWINENGPCIDCGSYDNLEVDHKDPKEKNFDPSGVWSRKAEIRLAELLKCVVRCNPCHIKKTLLGNEYSQHDKITSFKVIEIRNKYSNGGRSYRSLAKEYDIAYATIGRIVRNECWTHI